MEKHKIPVPESNNNRPGTKSRQVKIPVFGTFSSKLNSLSRSMGKKQTRSCSCSLKNEHVHMIVTKIFSKEWSKHIFIKPHLRERLSVSFPICNRFYKINRLHLSTAVIYMQLYRVRNTTVYRIKMFLDKIYII